MAKKKETKKTTTKKTDSDRMLEITENLQQLIDIVAQIQDNLTTVDRNCQYACDEVEYMRPRLERALGRLGL